MNPTLNSTEDKRSFFRVMAYVHILLESNKMEKPEKTYDTVDPILLELHHLKSRYEYDDQPNSEHFLNLLGLVEEMHDHMIHHKPLPQLQKTAVIISGSGVEFITTQKYGAGDKMYLLLGLMEYPFQTLELEVEVKSCKEYKEKKYKTSLAYLNISEDNRDLIIKFVNHVQRKNLNQKKNQDAESDELALS